MVNLTILSMWFDGKELAFAQGLNLSASRFGSVFNNLISPVLANREKIFGIEGVIMASLVALLVVLTSSVAAGIIFVIDKKIEKNIQRCMSSMVEKDSPSSYGSIQRNGSEQQHDIKLKDMLLFSRSFRLLAVYGLVLYGMS